MFALYQGDEVFVEMRCPTSQYAPGKIVFPGGHREVDDASITDTFLRELKEETGVIPTAFLQLTTLTFPDENIRLHPFAVSKWEGELPNNVHGVGNPLFWKKLSEMQQSDLLEISAIATMIQAHSLLQEI
jgi:8-oxo-dGTP pyrophosphatase MutT (NUDIX family)